jgi:hypothetical protein
LNFSTSACLPLLPFIVVAHSDGPLFPFPECVCGGAGGRGGGALKLGIHKPDLLPLLRTLTRRGWSICSLLCIYSPPIRPDMTSSSWASYLRKFRPTRLAPGGRVCRWGWKRGGGRHTWSLYWGLPRALWRWSVCTCFLKGGGVGTCF